MRNIDKELVDWATCKIKTDYKEDVSQDEIAERYSLSIESIRRILYQESKDY